jgi:hypothetical protein|tara:strand:+ start:4456 stop:4638 length:183 start_codon:yes stop_codon:yes gene_type:complete
MAKSEEMKGLIEYLKSAPGVRNIQYFSPVEAGSPFQGEAIKKQPPVARRLLIRSESRRGT